jgi:haloalkane dehalogenase
VLVVQTAAGWRGVCWHLAAKPDELFTEANRVSQIPSPAWLDRRLYPFEDRYMTIGESRVHYVDEGKGPVLLFMHGNPTWSFLYRDIIQGLRGRFRCVAVDYPGFGLSTAPAGYGFTPEEHSRIVEQFVINLGLSDITMMVQDWGGPVGFGVAVRHPELFSGFVVGNTIAWPLNDPAMEMFSRFMGGPAGRFLCVERNFFVNVLIPLGVRRKKLSNEVMEAYRGPFREKEARKATYIFPREYLGSLDYLKRVEAGMPRLKDLPALIVWGERDTAFRKAQREKFEKLFSRHQTLILKRAAHFIQEEAPEEIVDAIHNWDRWRS